MADTTVDQILATYKLGDKTLDTAIKDGLVGSVSASVAEKNVSLLTGPMGPVVCERLHAMQYLSTADWLAYRDKIYKRIAGRTIDFPSSDYAGWFSNFQSSVKSLQIEAGLVDDEWVGSKTFQALQQLFTFEEPTHLDDWFEQQYSSSFINRAIYVRLHALGILPGKKERFFDDLTSTSINQVVTQRHTALRVRVWYGLALWRRVLQKWEYSFEHGPKEQKSIYLLFDTDWITQWLATRSDAFYDTFHDGLRLPRNWEKKPYRRIKDTPTGEFLPLALRVMYCHARVEVWLNGYASGKNRGRRNGTFNPGDRVDASQISLFFVDSESKRYIGYELRLFHKFWQEGYRVHNQLADDNEFNLFPFDYDECTRAELRTFIKQKKLNIAKIVVRTCACAAMMNSIPEEKVEGGATTQTQRLNEEYQRLTSSQRERTTWIDVAKGFVANVLDGIKRLAKWFMRKLSTVLKQISDVAKMVIRLTKSLAAKAYTYFKKLTDIVSVGMSFLSNKLAVAHDHVKIVRDSDFDFTILTAPTVSNESIATASSELLYKVTMFRAMCSILQLFYKAMKIVIGIVSAFKVVDVLLALANFGDILSEEDKLYLTTALD